METESLSNTKTGPKRKQSGMMEAYYYIIIMTIIALLSHYSFQIFIEIVVRF